METNTQLELEPDIDPTSALGNEIYQESLYSTPIVEISAKFGVSFSAITGVLLARSKHTTDTRRVLALARLDMITKALMPDLLAGRYQAIHVYLKVQEREARLTGMDKPGSVGGVLTLEIPWLTQDRLAYKNQSGEVVDNVTDITPIIEVRKVAETPWKKPLETSETRLAEDIDKLSS